jgi:hypothetical protein
MLVQNSSTGVVDPLDRGRAYAAKVPGAISGQGGDRHTFALACRLKEFGCTSSEALRILEEWNSKCVPPWHASDLQRKVDCAYLGRSTRKSTGFRRSTSSIEPDQNRIQLVCAGGMSLATLEQADPCRLDPGLDRPETYLKCLYPGDPLLCCGWDKYKFDCRPLSEWAGELASMQFLVPSAAATRDGLTQQGKTSRHAKSMFPVRQYLVVESDLLTHDQQAAVLQHLAHFLPLVLVVDSGGKSLHGYFDVRTVPEHDALKFFRYARLLGADPTGWNIDAFKRMPGGRRENGRHQRVLFFNPFRKLV